MMERRHFAAAASADAADEVFIATITRASARFRCQQAAPLALFHAALMAALRRYVYCRRLRYGLMLPLLMPLSALPRRAMIIVAAAIRLLLMMLLLMPAAPHFSHAIPRYERRFAFTPPR